jgi:hypothetical protein
MGLHADAPVETVWLVERVIARARGCPHSPPQARIARPVDKRRASHPLPPRARPFLRRRRDLIGQHPAGAGCGTGAPVPQSLQCQRGAVARKSRLLAKRSRTDDLGFGGKSSAFDLLVRKVTQAGRQADIASAASCPMPIANAVPFGRGAMSLRLEASGGDR